MTQLMRIKWIDMDADGCGCGAPGEDYQLLYKVTFNKCTTLEWNRMVNDIERIAQEFTEEDNETEQSPCDILYGGDRLSADDYIVARMAELWPDVKIEFCSTDTFTVEIN